MIPGRCSINKDEALLDVVLRVFDVDGFETVIRIPISHWSKLVATPGSECPAWITHEPYEREAA